MERRYRPSRPLDLTATMAPLRRGSTDPAVRVDAAGGWWWATRTPSGTALLHLQVRAGEAVVVGSAWGDGAQILLDGLPEMLGEGQDDASFAPAPCHPRLIAAARARPGVRVLRTRAVFEALAGAAIEQVVTGVEARRAWRDLLVRFGEAAPGPWQGGTGQGSTGPAGTGQDGARGGGHAAAGMRVPPSATAWAAIPSWEWLRAGVEERRRRVVQHAAHCASGLERTTSLPPERVEAALRSLPGVGVWTAAEVRQRAHGDADAFSFADYHVAKNVSWALTGEVLDDAGCAEVIERYRGHRYRVQRLLELAGAARPRRGPRMSLPRHTPSATGMRS